MLPERRSGQQAARWLYEGLRTAILEGRLRPGARLASTRDVSVQYGMSRGTVVAAFEQLKAEGYVEGSVGSGTFVSEMLPDDLLRVATGTTVAPSASPTPRRRLSALARTVAPFPVTENRPSRAFRSHVPALELFPSDTWAQVAARRLRRVSTSFLLSCPPAGYPPLQEAVCAYLGESRGVRCEPAQVAITSGVQEALDLTARLLLGPGDRACVEDPGYRGAVRAFEAVGARIVDAPVDEEGLDPRPAVLRGARLVYVTPAHQFPLGTAMSAARRLKLIDWARRSGSLVFEDDYDSEFRYAGRPIPAMQGLDGGMHVLFAGSFSKVLFPSLRLGYLVVPADLVDRVSALKSITNRHPPLMDQAVLCDFMTAGHFGRHVRRMRNVYGERLGWLLEGLRERLGGLLEVSRVEAGLQTSAWLRGGLEGESVARAAAARGIEVTPLSRYRRSRPLREGLQLGFAALDRAEITRGVRELAAALEEGPLTRSGS